MDEHALSLKGKLAAIRELTRSITAYAGAGTWYAGGLMIAAAVLEGAGLVLLIPILSVIISGPLDNIAGEALNWLGVTQPGAQLQVLLAAFVLAALLRAQITHMRDLTLGKIQLGFSRVERVEVIGRLANAGWSRLVEMSHARITSLINNDVSRAVTAAQFLLRITVAVLLVLVNSLIAFMLAPDLVLLLVGFLGLGAVFLVVMQRDAFALGSRVRGSAQAMIGGTQNLLSGLKTALAQEQQGWFIGEFQRVQLEVFSSQFGFQRSQSNSRRIFAIASALVASSLVLGGYLLEVEPTSLIIVVVILSRLTGPILQLQQNIQQLLFSLPSVVAVQRLRRELPPAKPADVVPIERVQGDLELQDIVYRHRDGGGAGPLSLTIKKGEFVGIEGASGAGKSTLVDVMAGLLQPHEGRMLVDGTPLTEKTYAGWRRNLAYLGQQTYLFNDTLRANLAWNEVPPSDDEIWEALELAGVGDLVRGLQLGLDTPLGEQGVLFSGGERQRIALARGLLKKPGFLILDEATSAIDIASERALLDRLHALPERPTILMVAHRRESLVRCERVISMDRGRIVPS